MRIIMNKKKYIFIIIILLFILLSYPIRSYLIMSIYSSSSKKESVFVKNDINIKIKGGSSTLKRDYYPFVMYFNDPIGFSQFSHVKSDFSIIYNFGSFEFPFVSSTIFNENSKYCSTFYGAYAVKPVDDNYAFGFKEGKINTKEMVLVPKYDLTVLVLKDLGCKNIQFSYKIQNVKLNNEGFYVIDAILTTNSITHRYNGFKQNYLQYGRPNIFNKPKDSFGITNYYGKIYAKYLKEKNVTLFYYIITQNKQTLEETEKKFIQTIKY